MSLWMLPLAVVLAAVLAWAVTRTAYVRALTRKEAELDAERRFREQEARHAADMLAREKEKMVQSLDVLRKDLEMEQEKRLQQREASLKTEAQEAMQRVTEALGRDIKLMRDAFESQKRQSESNVAVMRTKFDDAVQHMREQTQAIGGKADKLAEALRHDNKLQGNWGERMLKNIFDQEGLVEGRDYDREDWLRDAAGNLLLNEDSGNRMRPDYILHFPDDTDVIVDAKLNLDAYVDWYNAETDEARESAARRNLEAVQAQIRSLSGKRYQDHIRRKSLNYVIMYVSNYGALQLARHLAPEILNEAFRHNVLITTEETLMPFLRLIHTAWVNVEQVRNQEKIVDAARLMVERVADFCDAHAAVGKKLAEALEIHEKSTAKLQEKGQSIVHSAREVVRLGVPMTPRKRLPELES